MDYADTAKYQHMAGAVGLQSGTATDAPDAPTFITPIRNATHSMAELSMRLDALANRLVGASPPTPSNAIGSAVGKLAAVPSSVFDQVADLGRQMNSDIGFAFDALNRIERALP